MWSMMIEELFCMVEKGNQNLIGSEQRIWLDRLEDDYENLQLALDYYHNSESGAERELKLDIMLSPFWEIRGYYSNGRAMLQRALARQQPGASPLKARALAWLGALMCAQGDYTAAKQKLFESVTMSRTVEDKECLALSLQWLGNIAEVQS